MTNLKYNRLYWTVRIYYGGDGPIWECFRTHKEAVDFYNKHDRCDSPTAFTARTWEDVRWAEARIGD